MLEDAEVLTSKPDIQMDFPKNQFIRFTTGLLGVYFFFWVLLLALKGVFVWFNWRYLRVIGYSHIVYAFWEGLRFEAATLAYLLSPALLLFYKVAATKWRLLRRIVFIYLVALSLLLSLICLT